MKLYYFRLLAIVIISFLGTIVYSNTFFCSFHFDDYDFIIQNPAIRDVYNLQNIWHYFHGRFITFFSLALNYHFNGLNVFGYHLFNLLVHLISAILVSWLTLLTLSTPAMKEPPAGQSGDKISSHANLIALFAGLVFVSHPVQIEAVTYIWQRAALMAALFYLLSLCFYVKSRLLQAQPTSSLGMAYYAGSLITAVLAMFTKENSVTLPLMILLYEFIFFNARRGLNWKYITPLLLTLFIIPVTLLFLKTQTFQSMHGDLRVSGGLITPMHYFLTQIRVMVTYTRLVFFPFHLNFAYDYPIYSSVFVFPVFISLLFLMSVFYCANRLFSKYRLVTFSVIWFFLTLTIPESSFWAMQCVIFEHRLYLPLVGYSLFLVSGVYYLLGKNNIKMFVIILLGIITINSVLTFQRNKVWKDEFTLWDDTIKKSPHKIGPYLSRGFYYFHHGNFEQALSDFGKIIEIDPNYPPAYNNRGLVYMQEGKLREAIFEYSRAIAIKYPTIPKNADLYFIRGLLYDKSGNHLEAISDYTSGIEMSPHDPRAYFSRGMSYFKIGKFSQAVSDLSKAVELNPNYANDPNFIMALKKASGRDK